MARRSTRDRLEAARRAATLERLVSSGILRERAEAALDAYIGSHAGQVNWEAAYVAVKAADPTSWR